MNLLLPRRGAFLGLIFALLSTTAMKADDLTVFAAASLTDALKEISANYEKTSGDKIAFNFAASGTLELQIRHGAPADIFFSADEPKMDDLAKDGLLEPDTRRDLLANTLVGRRAPRQQPGPHLRRRAGRSGGKEDRARPGEDRARRDLLRRST